MGSKDDVTLEELQDTYAKAHDVAKVLDRLLRTTTKPRSQEREYLSMEILACANDTKSALKILLRKATEKAEASNG